MKYFKLLPLVLALFIIPFTSHAWGTTGHRVIGAVAETYLTPQARKAVKEILGNESMAMVSNWADFVKSDTAYNYLYNWHFLDFRDSLSYADVMHIMKTDTAANVYNKTQWIISELKKKDLAKDKKVMYLKLLIHFIGDIHQPLHHGNEKDLGGNRVKVSWFNESTNLHTVWDTKLVDFQQLSYTEYVNWINHATTAQRIAWQKQPMTDWIYESYEISRKIYKNTPADSKLSYRYNYEWVSTVNSQLLKGGVRLAGILNEIFK